MKMEFTDASVPGKSVQTIGVPNPPAQFIFYH